MRRLSRPGFSQQSVFAACLQGIGNIDLASRCNAVTQYLCQQEARYDQLGSQGQLHLWQSHPRGFDANIAVGEVTVGEFKWLYTNQLARELKPARIYYDQLRVSAPGNICPYCGFGVVETIDHFLPKGHYSSLSLLPLNLVPACRDCNFGKNAVVFNVFTMPSHPYFEEDCVFEDEWLKADIAQDPIPHVGFNAVPPADWPIAISQRVKSHFTDFDLAKRYSVQGAERLKFYANMINDLVGSGAAHLTQNFLVGNVRSELNACGLNSWQTALARAVATDAWFMTTGYSRLL